MSRFDFKRDITPFLVATIGEFVALTLWLYWLNEGRYIAASAALWSGFAVERLAVAVWVRFVFAPATGASVSPWLATGVFLTLITGVELAIWTVWISASRHLGIFLGAAILFVLIHSLHSGEMAAVKRQSPLIYVSNAHTIFFSLMETLGGTGWWWLQSRGHPFLGAFVLLAGLTIEHLVQGSQLKPSTTQ